MNRINYLVVCLFAFVIVSGCIDSLEKQNLERRSKTLAGSIASEYEYLAIGEIDGTPVGVEDPILISFEYNDRDKLSIRLRKWSKADALFYDYISISSSPFNLNGSPADVTFNDNIQLSFSRTDGTTATIEAKISGWLKNTFLLEELWTKMTVARYKYVGRFETEWIDDVNHKLIIDRIESDYYGLNK